MNTPSQKLVLPSEAGPSSLALRAVLAILLTIGFYGLALAIAGVLLFFVYAEFAYAHRINIRVTLICLAGAGTILWAIFPRIDRFEPPGARLLPTKQPRLFQSIQSIADQVGQKMPAEVYLVQDVNAFVTERGGFMGIGRKRVMGIGLPLLQMLTVKQLQAILAHEFGHFYGGDTSLGPWIYKTRMAIIRTVAGLGDKSLLQAPFRWYGTMFLRVTQAISRRQELVADALGAAVAGAEAMIASLKAVHGLAPAFNAFMQNEVVPVFNGGYRPPLASGFAQFAQTGQVHEAIQNIVDTQLKEAKSDPYDSHPALPERIRAIQALPARAALADDTPAITLIDNCLELEQEMLATLYGQEKVADLKPVGWEEVGETVYLTGWKKTIETFADALAGLTAPSLPEFRSPEHTLAARIVRDKGQPPTAQALQGAVDYLLGMALAVMLSDAGWRIITQPGCDFTFTKDGKAVKPFELLRHLNEGKIKPEDWPGYCEEQGIADLSLK